MSDSDGRTVSDPRHFRSILGHFPTGVVAVTSLDADGKPTGMAVGSFTSVSLDPPLVAFLPDKSSSTFPKIRDSGRFCVNVLGAHQQPVCTAMSIKGGDKFADIEWSATAAGMPRIHDSVAWIDCTINEIHEAGDHYIVVGRVDDLGLDTGQQPLVFFQGGYGRFASTSLTAPAELDLYRSMAVLETARPFMAEAADDLGVECCASTVVGEQLVLIGSSIPASLGHPPRIRLGRRMPFTAPLGMGWAAWLDDVGRARWESGPAGMDRAELGTILDRVREQGWTMVLHTRDEARLERAISAMDVETPDPESVQKLAAAISDLDLSGHGPTEIRATEGYDVRHMSAPVFGHDGNPVLLLSLYQAPRGLSGEAVDRMRTRLLEATVAASEAVKNR